MLLDVSVDCWQHFSCRRLLVALTSCGSDEQTPTGAPASSDSAESDTPGEAESEEPAETDAAEVDGTLNTKTFLPALKAGVEGKTSAHVTMDLTAAGQSMTVEGDTRLDEADPAMMLTMNGAAFGESTVEMRLVDDLVYMSIPPMTPRGKFIKVDPKDKSNPLGASMGNLTDQMDPLSTFDAFDAGLRNVKYVGEESVSGENLDRYRVSVDFPAASRAQGQPVVPGMPKIVRYDIWLDDENLMRRMAFDLGQQVSMEMTASQWGDPVSVEAPPANNVVQGPGTR